MFDRHAAGCVRARLQSFSSIEAPTELPTDPLTTSTRSLDPNAEPLTISTGPLDPDAEPINEVFFWNQDSPPILFRLVASPAAGRCLWILC